MLRSRWVGWTAAFSLLLLETACLKLIDVDVSSDTGEIVIEGYYTDQDSAVVRISQTVGYFQDAAPPSVSAALVILEEIETGAKDTLRWQDSAYFRTRGQVQPVVGHHYRLQVQLNGETIISQSLPLMVRVGIDTLLYAFREAQGPLPAGYRLIGIVQEQPGEGQGYRLRVWRNDTLQNKLSEWIYSDDRYIDGRLAIFELPFEAKATDTFYVQLWTMPREVIRFYDQLVRNAFGGSGGFSPPPDNAYSNFTGSRRRVWGYFTTLAVDGRGIRIPPG
jgi:hypothetical protein